MSPLSPPEVPEPEKSDFDNLTYIGAFIGVVGAALLFGLFIWTEWNNPEWSDVAFKHFQATIGLPAAVAGAFTVVALFRTTEGKIKFEVIGFKFEGASGPIVMWVLCFLAIVLGIKALW